MFKLARKSKEEVAGKRPKGGDTGLVSVTWRFDFVLTPLSLAASSPFIQHIH